MSYVGRQEEKSAPVIRGLNMSFPLMRMMGSAVTELNNCVPFSAPSAERLILALTTTEETFRGLTVRRRALNASALAPPQGASVRDQRRSARLCLALKNLSSRV